MLCVYGCGQEAKFQFKNGKWCCSKYFQSCLGVKKKNVKTHIGAKNSMFGKHHNKESIQKMSKAKIGKRRTPFEDIIKFVKDEGYELLSKKEDYKNSFSYVEVRCPKGHEYNVRWDQFKAGQRCRKCRDKMRGDKLRTPFKEIRKFVENTGYELLSKESDYKDQFSKLWFRCPEGHEFLMRWDGFKGGFRCRECFYEMRRGTNISKEIIKKIRLSTIKRRDLLYGNCYPNYNSKACRMIDEYGKENDYNFQHAENGGEYHIKELGYWVDGYDKEKNVVIEIDENAHFDKDGNLKEKDVLRQKEITDFLSCDFIRLKI